MANGDSAIEMMDATGSPDHRVVAESHLGEGEPLEEDVFLPVTPVSKFSKLPARAHSTPRPAGSPTDSDTHLHFAAAPDYAAASGCPDHRRLGDDDDVCGGAGPPRSGDGPLALPRSKQFAFCLALFGLAVLVGFLAGYLVREKVFEREAVLVVDRPSETGTIPSALMDMYMYHHRAVNNVSANRIADYSSFFSQHQCATGSPCSQSMSALVVDRLKEMGFADVDVLSYNVLTSLPDMSRASTLQTMDLNGDVIHSEVLYGGQADSGGGGGGANARRRRRIDETQPNATSGQSTVMYMPFSGSGQIQGELVYVHYASQGDLLMLAESNIDVQGKIGIARQGTMMVVDQARNVQEHGMMGLILYTDPSDMDAIAGMGMERLVGMTGMMGDLLTPGCPAMDGISRMTATEAGLPSILVQPVSTDLAAGLLGNMTGRMAPSSWQGGLGTMYYMGLRNSRKSTWTVQLDISNMQMQQPIHDVVTTIRGTQMPDEYIILGGHFPMMATMAGMGTGDHGSASMLMEVATVMSQMMTVAGWQPRRSVVLGLWGGAEYGNAGSSEWAEEHRRVLAERAVSYIDLDTAPGAGETVTAMSSPLLKGMILEAANTLEMMDVIRPGTLTGTGDHVAFSHTLGIPSAHLYAPHDISQGNPTASASMTKLATQMVMMLADGDMIPFRTTAMGEMLVGYADSFDSKMGDTLTLSNLTLGNLKMAAADFMAVAMEMQRMMGNVSMMQSSVTMTMVNHRLMHIERAFVDMDASGSMTNVLYGMTEMDTFPLIAEYAPGDMSNETMATMMQRVSFMQCTIQSATLSLKMGFS